MEGSLRQWAGWQSDRVQGSCGSPLSGSPAVAELHEPAASACLPLLAVWEQDMQAGIYSVVHLYRFIILYNNDS